MKYRARRAVVLAIFTFSSVYFEGLALKPGCNEDQLHACGSDFIVYGSVTMLPERGQEFQDYCERITKQLSCALNFTNTCVEGLPRVAGVLGLQAMEEEYEVICREGTDHYELYQRSIKCMNTAGVQLNGCQMTMRDDMEKAVLGAPREKIGHYGCCAFHKNSDCFDVAMADCSETPAKEFIDEVMDKISGGVIDLVCGKYSRGSTACAELPDLPAALNSKDLTKKDLFGLVLEMAAAIVKKS